MQQQKYVLNCRFMYLVNVNRNENICIKLIASSYRIDYINICRQKVLKVCLGIGFQ